MKTVGKTVRRMTKNISRNSIDVINHDDEILAAFLLKSDARKGYLLLFTIFLEVPATTLRYEDKNKIIVITH